MSDRAIELIRKCMAVAASTPHVGERQAALARAAALCRKHDLDPTLTVMPDMIAAVEAVATPTKLARQSFAEMDAQFWREWEAAKHRFTLQMSREELLNDPSWLQAMKDLAVEQTADLAADFYQ